MPVSRSVDRAGLVFGNRYRLQASVGSGASASVYLADDAVLGRKVAIKVLHDALADDQAFLQRFRAEARAAAALNHPHVMAVYDWGEERAAGGVRRRQTLPYLVTEYLGGGSLRALLGAQGRLSPAQTLKVGIEAVGALEYAHKRGIVHRDVKPANLLFDEDGRLRIADFGLARALAEAAWSEPAGALLGTARYASPEQARGRPLDGRSDVYSLALLLVEAVTGKVPFAADTTIGTLMGRLDQPLPVDDDLGPLAAPLRAAGHPDPAMRLDAAAFRHALAAVVESYDEPEPLALVGAHVVELEVDRDGQTSILVLDDDGLPIISDGRGSGTGGASRAGGRRSVVSGAAEPAAGDDRAHGGGSVVVPGGYLPGAGPAPEAPDEVTVFDRRSTDLPAAREPDPAPSRRRRVPRSRRGARAATPWTAATPLPVSPGVVVPRSVPALPWRGPEDPTVALPVPGTAGGPGTGVVDIPGAAVAPPGPSLPEPSRPESSRPESSLPESSRSPADEPTGILPLPSTDVGASKPGGSVVETRVGGRTSPEDADHPGPGIAHGDSVHPATTVERADTDLAGADVARADRTGHYLAHGAEAQADAHADADVADADPDPDPDPDAGAVGVAGADDAAAVADADRTRVDLRTIDLRTVGATDGAGGHGGLGAGPASDTDVVPVVRVTPPPPWRPALDMAAGGAVLTADHDRGIVGPGSGATGDRPEPKRWPVVMVVMALLAGALVGGVYWAVALRVPSFPVPTLVGRQIDEVDGMVAGTSWSVRQEKRADDTAPIGRILGQQPPPGTEVLRGGSILVTVSSGPPLVDVPPDLAGQTLDSVRRILQAAQLQVGKMAVENNETVPLNSVIRLKEGTPAKITKFSAVDLVVSAGPVARTIPDGMVGMRADDAVKALTDLGLKPTRDTVNDEKIPEGMVVKLDKQPGQSVPRDTAVVVSVSKGPKKVLVPNVIGMSASDAANTLSSVGLVAGDVSGLHLILPVTGTDPAPGTEVRLNTQINLKFVI